MVIPDDIAETGVILKDRLFDLRGLSVYSTLGVSTLRDHIRKDGLPCFKIGGKILVKLSEFDKWLEGYRLHKGRDINSIADDVMRELRA
jgi:hypothetical protein